VACGGCANPVVRPHPKVASRPAREPSRSPAETEALLRRLWRTAALVLALLLLAHAGLYLLLTAGPRGEAARLEARHGRAALEGAEAPAPPPAAGTPAYATWRRQRTLWIDAEAWGTDRRQANLLFGGFLASFAVLAGMTLWILARLRARARGRVVA
jgi:hypothetical protein